jgi:putative phosphoribosyl transferase
MADEREVIVHAAGVKLEGTLAWPEAPSGLVLFAHGSGSSRHSPRNREVAESLREAGIGTLLFDLLTAEEEPRDRYSGLHRFDIGLLSGRLVAATEWAIAHSDARGLPIGYFGASTAAAR